MLISLKKNEEYSDSPITVYCDGAKTKQEFDNVLRTREIIYQLLPKATVVEHKSNFGVAASIVRGVSEQCKKYGRVIVFEDDLLLSPVVLKYFNRALAVYQHEKNVMHVAAYTLPLNGKLPDSYFSYEMSCWGWATWGRAWKKFELNAGKLADSIFNNKLTTKFNSDNSYLFWEMLLAQQQGLIDSWDICWYASIFINNGLALNPGKSLIQNIGFDGSGTHCNITDIYDVELSQKVPEFPAEIKVDKAMMKLIRKHRNPSFLKMFVRKIKHYRAVLDYSRK